MTSREHSLALLLKDIRDIIDFAKAFGHDSLVGPVIEASLLPEDVQMSLVKEYL